MIAGYHIEGPWLSPEPGYHGAHPAERMCAPSLPDFHRLQAAANGNIRLITLAPEWPGSAEAIAAMTAARVEVSLGHTNATEVRKRFGIEAAQVILGHKDAKITQVYAERNLRLAREVVQALG